MVAAGGCAARGLDWSGMVTVEEGCTVGLGCAELKDDAGIVFVPESVGHGFGCFEGQGCFDETLEYEEGLRTEVTVVASFEGQF